MGLIDVFLYFIIYSVIGWVCEVVFCSILNRKPVNRGFLHGPYCPIYGVGAVICLFVLSFFEFNPVLVFFVSTAVFTVTEYFSSFLLEKFFGLRWWDYSKFKFNLNGRICLQFSLVFGALGVVMIYVIHPIVLSGINLLTVSFKYGLSSFIIAIFVIDVIYTVSEIFHLSEKLKQTQNILNDLKKLPLNENWYDESRIAESLERLLSILHFENSEQANETIAAIEDLKNTWAMDKRFNWLLKIYIHVNQSRLSGAIALARSHTENIKESALTKAKDFLHISLKTKPEQTLNKSTESFARGLNFYKLVWVFCIASVIGFCLETVYCLVTLGYIESRQGMIYGPFNQVYGFGAVIMMLILNYSRNWKGHWIFLFGAVIGGAFEWLCSFVQEKVFTTKSWEYSENVGNIGGRTSVMYMIFWGILALFLLKEIFPLLSNLIEKIPNRQGKVLSWVLIITLSFDMIISAAAVDRWAKRDKGIAPANVIEEYIDGRYPDRYMNDVYPNMNFV